MASAYSIPPQSAATSRWWALRWYENASADERAAMAEIIAECGTGGQQDELALEPGGQCDENQSRQTAMNLKAA